MQHRIIFSLALVLGLVPTLNAAPLFAMPHAQQAEACEPVRKVTVGDETFEFKLDCTNTSPDYFSEGLQVAVVPEAGSDNQLYAVQFFGEGDASNPQQGAYIPERFNSEAMVVKVLAGNFAFRTQGPGVIVDPDEDQLLEGLESSTPIELGTDPNIGTPRTYNNADPYPCNLLVHGHTLCLLVPTDFTAEDNQDMFVRLDPGDTVFLPDNSTCFLCNSGRIDANGNEVPTDGIPAELLIWSATTGFNGDLENIATAMAPPSAGTPTVQGSGRIVGWMFNPGGRCN